MALFTIYHNAKNKICCTKCLGFDETPNQRRIKSSPPWVVGWLAHVVAYSLFHPQTYIKQQSINFNLQFFRYNVREQHFPTDTKTTTLSSVRRKWAKRPRAFRIIIKYLMSYSLISIMTVKNLIMMQKTRGRLICFNWTCGQGKAKLLKNICESN